MPLCRSEHVDKKAEPRSYWAFDLLNPMHLVRGAGQGMVCSSVPLGTLCMHCGTFAYLGHRAGQYNTASSLLPVYTLNVHFVQHLCQGVSAQRRLPSLQ